MFKQMRSVDTESLKHCPWCGHTDLEVKTDYRSGSGNVPCFWVECAVCGAHGPTANAVKVAVRSWEERA